MSSVTVTGIDDVLRNIEQLTNDSARRRVLMAGAMEARRIIADYPPATIANSSTNPAGRWYERGFGTRTLTGKEYRTSQTLGRKWTVRATGSGAVVGNNVSYAPFVQGERQAWFHAARGWLTVETLATSAEHTARIRHAMNEQMRREIARAEG